MNIYDIQRSGNVIHAYLTNDEVNAIRQFKSVKQINCQRLLGWYSYDTSQMTQITKDDQ